MLTAGAHRAYIVVGSKTWLLAPRTGSRGTISRDRKSAKPFWKPCGNAAVCQINTTTRFSFSTMAFLKLPNELIIEIGEYCDEERDIYILIRVNRRFYHLFHDRLYRINMQHGRSSAIFWAVKRCRESTARTFLHLGGDVNVQAIHDMTPLHLAAEQGHLAMVKLLLEVGADPDAKAQESRTPVYAALTMGYEKVARTISRRVDDLHHHLVHSKERLTPLHVSCRRGLWNCARYFLDRGVDVNAQDVYARTPLHHVLG